MPAIPPQKQMTGMLGHPVALAFAAAPSFAHRNPRCCIPVSGVWLMRAAGR